MDGQKTQKFGLDVLMADAVSGVERDAAASQCPALLQHLREELMRHEAAVQRLFELAFSNQLSVCVGAEESFALNGQQTLSVLPSLTHSPVSPVSPCSPAGRRKVFANKIPSSMSSLSEASEVSDPSSPSHKKSGNSRAKKLVPTDEEFSMARKASQAKGNRSILLSQRASIHATEGSSRFQEFQSRLQRFLVRNSAEYTVAILIIANSASFGIHADYAVKNPASDPPAFMRPFDVFFAAAFTIELALRIAAYGRLFLSISNPDICWNVLDMILVMLSLVEEVLSAALSNAPDVSISRLLRLLRLVRLVRVIRVFRFFKDLRVMVLGIYGSMKPLLWAMLLLALIMYTFAVVLLQFVSDELAKPMPSPAAQKVFFSSIWRAVYTLYMCISAGISWIEVAEPLHDINPILTPAFVCYIALAVFCVLNIVTGVFVDRSAAMILADEESVLMEEFETRKKWFAEVEAIFHAADNDGSGDVEFDEFQECMKDFRLQACLKNLGIDMQRISAAHLWTLLDTDNSGSVEISEFAAGLQQIHGNARSVDLIRISHEQKTMNKKFSKLLRVCEEQFECLFTQSATNAAMLSRLVWPCPKGELPNTKLGL